MLYYDILFSILGVFIAALAVYAYCLKLKIDIAEHNVLMLESTIRMIKEHLPRS